MTDAPGAVVRRRVFAAGFAVAVAILTIRVGWIHRQGLFPDLVLDDAYISFRYARNLVGGEGLVFNPGERVEGYTNFLWTLLMAGALAAGAEPEPAAEVLAGLAAVGSLLLLAALARRLLRGRLAAPASVLPAVVFAALGSQARYVVSGMETLLFVFLVLAAFSCLLWRWRSSSGRGAGGSELEPPVRLREAGSAGLLFALATMTRPEGALFAALGGTWALYAAGQRVEPGGRLRARMRAAVGFAAAFLGLYGPYTWWRVSYYGHPLPNTFYAKVAGPRDEVVARGWESLVTIMASWPVWPLLAVAALALLPPRSARRDPLYPAWIWLAAVVAATWASFVVVGGDFLPFFGPRMLMPALPFVLLMAAEGVRRSAAAVPWRPAGQGLMIAALVGLPLYGMVAEPWPKRQGRLGGIATYHHSMQEVAAWLVRQAPEGASIAAPGVGIVPYVTGWSVVDMYGLVDEHIAHHGHFNAGLPAAHAKSDPHYVLDRRPDFLISEVNPAGVARSARLGWARERVARDYQLVAQVKKGRGRLSRGRRVIEVDRFRPRLHRRGYDLGVFRRKAGNGKGRAIARPLDLSEP